MFKRISIFRLLHGIIAALLSYPAFSQVPFPFTLGKEYLRSEITAVVGTPDKYGYDFGNGEDDLNVQLYAKGVIINQAYSNLNLKWVLDEEGAYPIVDFHSSKYTRRRAPLIGLALTDPTYRILEDKIPGGLYVGMPRLALKSIKGDHTDGWPVLNKNNYRIVFDDDTMVLMYYNAWDRITFIEYLSHQSGIFSWPKEDPYTPVDEKDTLVTAFHGPDELKGILVPSNPSDTFASLFKYNRQDNPTVLPNSAKVPFPSLLDFNKQQTNSNTENLTLVYTPFRENGWRGLKAVLHDIKDDINWEEAAAIRWSYLQESNRAILKDYIVTQFARKGYDSNQRNYSFLPITRPTKILVYRDFNDNVHEIRIYHGGRIYLGRFLMQGDKLQPGEKVRYVTVFKDTPRPKLLGFIRRKNKREIIGTYCIAESKE